MKTLLEISSEINEMAKEIAELTSLNYHNEAVMVLSKYLKMEKYTKILEKIEEIHELMGYIEIDLHRFRSSIHNIVFEYAKKELPKEYYNKLMKSY